MWNLIILLPDYCLSVYFSYFAEITNYISKCSVCTVYLELSYFAKILVVKALCNQNFHILPKSLFQKNSFN